MAIPQSRHAREAEGNRTSPLAITYQGCKAICGGGLKANSWADITEVLTTWILPVLGGIMLQIPIEGSGAACDTLLHLVRWLGNPMAVLARTLLNIVHTRRACRLLDCMTGPDFGPLTTHDGGERGAQHAGNVPAALSAIALQNVSMGTPRYPRLGTSDFAELRNGFFLLTVLNQYHIEPGSSCGGSGSGSGSSNGSASALPSICDMYAVIFFALFARNTVVDGASAAGNIPAPTAARSIISGSPNRKRQLHDLCCRRATLSNDLRATRKRSVVPIFFSVFWFGVAMAISISRGLRGSEASAQSLALGLLVGRC